MPDIADKSAQEPLPLITIGLTCYEAADSIERAIESALLQDWPHKEILIVDDCSTDGSVAVIERVAAAHSSIRLIRHDVNQGPGAARQTLLQNAQGEFLAFFDDDDVSAPQRIRTQYEAIIAYEAQHQADLIACYASGQRIYDNGYVLDIQAIGSRPLVPHGAVVADYLLFFQKNPDFFYGAGTPSCALMARTETIRKIGGFDSGLRRVEDVDFAIRLALAGGHFIGCPEKLYTQQATFAPDKAPEKNRDAEIRLAEKYCDYLQKRGRYSYARTWPRIRYYHFKRQYGRMALALGGLFLRAPIKVSSHLLATGPKRLLHERRMRRQTVSDAPFPEMQVHKMLFAIKALEDIQGGAERVLADITARLAAEGRDVAAVTFDREGAQPFYPLSDKVRLYNLGIGDTHASATFAETWQRMRALRRFVKEHKPDVAIGFMHSMFVPLAFALIGSGVPVVASEHIVPDHYKTRRFEFILFLLSSLFMRRITVLSKTIMKSYPYILRRKMVPVPNPVMIPEKMADTRGDKVARKTVLSVGRFDPQKDQMTLVRAFAKLAADFPDWDLRIVGDGALRGKLEAEIAALGLEERISLPGTTKEIGAEYAAAQLFVLPSLYESFGLVTAEAIAHGLPVIGFADCPGTNELIEDGKNGILVAVTNDGERVKDASGARAAALAKAMRGLMAEPARREKLAVALHGDVTKG